MIHTGSCLCGQIKYEIQGALTGVLHCHCSMCRKAHAAAFRTRASVQAKDFRWLSGEHLLTHYLSCPGEYHTFCRICGSRLITKFENNKTTYGFALGTLDTDPGVKPGCHIFVGSKALWHEITDGLPQYKEFPST
ncbi:MAG: GFA family protein [Gammaproteobacteria bacterium]|nr:GFA family protein [Gammaproteobacteria bacterium]